MTYDDFIQWVLRYAWRVGDDETEADVPVLIDMAETRLQRDLLVIERDAVIETGLTPGTRDLILPPDYWAAISLRDERGALVYVTPQEMDEQHFAIARGSRQWQDTYTTRGETLQVGHPEAAAGAAPTGWLLTYRTLLPRYADNPAGGHWVAKSYFDLLTYAVLQETPLYLREDPRTQLWTGRYAELLEGVRAADALRRRAGSPLRMKPASIVA